MRRSTFRRLAISAAVILLVLVPAGAAFAHGHASQGDLEMEIGFANEPAFTGQPNAVQLLLVHDGKPVTDLKTGAVTVAITFGDQTSEPMDMEPGFAFEDGTLEFGEPGEYLASFVPSQPGDYTFHFTGTVDGEKIDEEMTSSPKTFSSVESAGDAAFPPVEAPTNEELASRIEQEASRSQDSVAAASAAASGTEDAASSAKTVGLIGVVLGAVGIIAAIAALAASRRKV
jgi:hypothetical protein